MVDIAIVGAGPAGALAAWQLARCGKSVALIGRPGAPRRFAETLSPMGAYVLRSLGLWERFAPAARRMCPTITVAWETAWPETRSFLTNPYGCAWHVDRDWLDAFLVTEAIAAGARFVSGMASSTRNTGGWAVEVGAETIAATLLVCATGRSASLGAVTGHRLHVDPLCALGGFALPRTDCGDGLVVEATPDGWVYSAPTPDGRLFVGVLTDADLLAKLRRWIADPEWMSELAPLTTARLASVPRRWRATSARSDFLLRAGGDAWLAVGDAALARDPLSGEGLGSALQSAVDAADAALRWFAGDLAALGSYATRARRHADDYEQQRRAAYDATTRFNDRPFWTRRRRAAND